MFMGHIAELGIALTDLWDQHADWSQTTFGKDSERGPLGPLEHLKREAAEAQTAWSAISLQDALQSERGKKYQEELGDCLLLLLDATRRGGYSLAHLVHAAVGKLKVNKARQWPKVQDANAAVEHIKESKP